MGVHYCCVANNYLWNIPRIVRLIEIGAGSNVLFEEAIPIIRNLLFLNLKVFADPILLLFRFIPTWVVVLSRLSSLLSLHWSRREHIQTIVLLGCSRAINLLYIFTNVAVVFLLLIFPFVAQQLILYFLVAIKVLTSVCTIKVGLIYVLSALVTHGFRNKKY